MIEKDWTTKAGLRAVALFVKGSHRCGYVAVPRGHPLFGVAYNAETDLLEPPSADEPIGKRGSIVMFCAAMDGKMSRTPEFVFDVHGSLTYSGGDGEYPVPGDGLWWFGFDCAHAGDATAYSRHEGDVMRTLEYVEAECESLAAQLLSRVRQE